MSVEKKNQRFINMLRFNVQAGRWIFVKRTDVLPTALLTAGA